ncbi:LysM domain-containing protein [Desulfococcaceae bacterium HSG7]|nr:LysM domain-containing protein [Desulfococcaceae bacterium HSG7]
MLLTKCKKSGRCFLFVLIIIAFASICYAEAADTSEPLGDVDVQEDETGYYYIVKKGDTLWGLSRKFFNSSWLWPDLWEKNKQLPNPHWIYPGQRIRLMPKASKPVAEPMEEKPVVTIEKEVEEPLYFIYAGIDQIGFVRKEELTPSAYILVESSEEKFIDQGDVVYIKQIGNQRLRPGQLFTTYRLLEQVQDPASSNKLGIQYYITGVVEIIKNEDEFDVGRIIRSYRRILVKDLLMPYKNRSPKIALRESKRGIEGQIIDTEEKNRLLAANNIVFINRGKIDGMKTGQEYSIYKLKIANSVQFNMDFGSLLILHVEEAASTALITYSEHSIHPGEKFRTPVPSKE